MSAEQLSLTPTAPVPLARYSDPGTSHAAARSLTPGRLEGLILDVFTRCGPMTDDELAARLPGKHPPSVKTARSRLTASIRRPDAPLVDSLERRASTRGRAQIVWRVR